MIKPPTTLAGALRRAPKTFEGKIVPQKVRKSIAFWTLHDSLVKIDAFNGNGIAVGSKAEVALGGIENITKHYREGHLFYKWLAGTWAQIC